MTKAEMYKSLLERLDAGANHRDYPEAFGGSWTNLCSDAATAIRRLAAQADVPDGWKLVPIHGAEEKVARIKAIGDEVAALQADAPLPIPADKYAVDDPWCRPADLPQSPADVTDAHKHVMQAIKELHEASIPVPMSLHHAAHALHYADTRPDHNTEGRCICQDQHRRGYCTEPGCPYSSHTQNTQGE